MSRNLFVAVLLAILVGCARQPLTPEQQYALKLQGYCQLQAQAARDTFTAQQNQSQKPTGGFYGGVTEGIAQNTAYQAAYERCMMEMQQGPAKPTS